MPSITFKKQLWARLKELQATLDSIYLPMELEASKNKLLDLIAIVVGAQAAQVRAFMGQLSVEIDNDAEQARLMQEFKQLYKEEIERFLPAKPIDYSMDDDDEDYFTGSF